MPGNRPLRTRSRLPEEKKPEPEGKKPPPEERKPAPKGDTGVPSPRSGALSCDSHVVAEGSTVVIESPNYPSNYPNYEDCVYTLTTDTGKDLELSCEAFDLESHSQCRYDWLRVNGIKYCGSSGPSTMAAPQLDIDFHSDYSVVRSGYRCTVTVVEPTVVPAGSQLSCATTSTAYYQLYADQAGDQLSVTCSQFDVESHSSCAYDWLSVDGNKFCGSNGPSGVAAIDQMAIHWHTDYSVVRSGFVCAVTVGEASASDHHGRAAAALRQLRLRQRSIQVLLREHLINQDDGEIRFNIAQIKNHPNYNSGTYANDFSLLKLATAIILPRRQ
ncbi:Tolloid-like protein 1 [Amphibalanus amphitrite]|uniref:Tolloid-like protein 1 n=1 Tax=Amphibalanus amphitrite TaxID=1232801 RepID=A0A6A4XGF6_AMPAM|nr:Tolloid-like protein 1 [Amphibalanus amphitrite]